MSEPGGDSIIIDSDQLLAALLASRVAAALRADMPAGGQRAVILSLSALANVVGAIFASFEDPEQRVHRLGFEISVEQAYERAREIGYAG